MILKSFLLDNTLSLCMKIINSVVVVGLYYGFITTFSMGPSYLFLFRTQIMEEGVEKKVSATTGFITGQLMIFISIYYAPMYLALGRPHTITVLVLPYLLFHFFWKNQKHFFYYGSNTRKSMRNLSIQCIFLNNLIFQLFNHFILPSSTLARLVNLYLFRCNNKMLFITSSFIGWLINHLLLMKLVGLLLSWIWEKNLIRSNKELVSELRNSMARIFSILLFITSVYYLGKTPSPLMTKKLKETEEAEESEEERDEKIEKTIETKGIQDEQKGSAKKDPYLYSEEREDSGKLDKSEEIALNGKEILKDEEDKDLFWFEKSLVTLLFDYKRWNRPLRYIKNDRFENAVRNEMSQYFFYTCPSDGKQKISFTYPASLSTFWEILQRHLSLYTTEKGSPENLYNNWACTNKEKRYNLSNELINRIEAIDKGPLSMDVLEKRIRLCNDENEQECLPKLNDPFFNGSYRGTIKKVYSRSIVDDSITSTEDSRGIIWINKIYEMLFRDSREFEHKMDDKLIDLEEINKKVPRYSYKLIDDDFDLEEEEEEENEEESTEEPDICSRKAKRVVIYTDDKDPNTNIDTNTSTARDQEEEVFLIRYSQQSDFRRDLIKGSMRAQRRKTVTWELFEANTHSPLFLDRIDKTFFFSFDFFEIMSLFFRNWRGKDLELKTSDSGEKGQKEKDKKRKKEKERIRRIEIGEFWDTTLITQIIRGSMLIIQSILRKYIILPSLIVVKNLSRMLLLQLPEWYEDFKEWNKEMHVKCTYNGVQLSETEFPEDWLADGIQIKILFPFCLKPWYGSERRSPYRDPTKKKGKEEDFCYLTVWGMETEVPFGSPRKQPSFFKPVWKELEKKIIKIKNQRFQIIKVLKERTKRFIKLSKEKKSWVRKKVLFIKKTMKALSLLFKLRKGYEPSENRKDSITITSNKVTHESTIRIRSMDWTNFSLTEKKIKDLATSTITIRDQINRITEDKKKSFLTSDMNLSPNKTNSHDKRSESTKVFWQISKKRSARLIRKCHFFFKLFIEKIYIDIFLSTIKIPTKNAQLLVKLLESTKRTLDNYIYNDEINQKRIRFISTIKRPISNIRNKKSRISCDLSSLSQAYVFYKLSQTPVINKHRFGSVLHYRGTSTFIKYNIKERLGALKIFDHKSRYKKLQNSTTNEWKNWLRSHYQYNLSQTKWSRLVPKKWQKRINKCRMIQKKDQLIRYEKENDYGVTSLLSKKKKLIKKYRYALFSDKYINYEDSRGSYISQSPLQVRGGIPYNSNTSKPGFFYVLGDIASSDYLREEYIIHTDQNPDRKYLEWGIFKFSLIKYIDSKTGVDTGIGTYISKDTKTDSNYYQIIDKRDLFYVLIRQEINPSNQKKKFFDWMWVGMNKEMLYRPIPNIEPRVFPEFLLLYDSYKMKPWVIPTQLFFFHFHENENISKNINGNKKKDLHISGNQKDTSGNQKVYLELKNENPEEKEQRGQGNFILDTRNQEKDSKKDYEESGIKKYRKKRKYKSKEEAELDLLLKRYLLFQLRWEDHFNQILLKNIKVYCLLLRLINPIEIAISSIQTREMSLDILMIHKDLTVTDLIKKGIFFIEPMRLSLKWDAEFLMYKTIGISLVHRSKHKINGRCREKEYADDNDFNGSIRQHIKTFVSGYKKHFYLLVPENILSSRRRRDLRILMDLHENVDLVLCNRNKIKNCLQFFDADKYTDIDTHNLIEFKLFLWPNYRLEDLACMNRYWFDTNNGSRFSMSKIHMYPRYIIDGRFFI
uniref:hypothetical protein RF1 n=1 Tax=Lactoris fernandeziana TaxID=22303 RepID=UPI0021151265|nr:hypothetical protein RF1 [Lactoris fernandeziana]DAZ89826.1 TPA_asm: hypothetical protein RF1 [Lactoris fernandeziana]